MKKETKQAFELTNLRAINVKYIAPTNHSGDRICIFENKRFSDDRTQRKYFSYSYEYDSIMEQAYSILIANGFNVVCRSSDFDKVTFLCNNWGEDFKLIKDLK